MQLSERTSGRFMSSLSDLLGDGQFLSHLPVGVYVCDSDGLIVGYNRAAAQLWGRAPEVGDPAERFCGSYQLLGLDGIQIPHAECPMAVALATGAQYTDQRIQIERPDGSRITALANIQPLRDPANQVVGAVNVFRDSALHWSSRQLPDGGGNIREQVLKALPVAIYTTDAAGKITFYNEAAVSMWGVRPEIGQSEFCGSWKLYGPDGAPLPHDQCPMAIALREQRALRGQEATAERPDGKRIPFLAYPTPLFNEAGELTGAVNMLVDISGRKTAELASHRLAAIVESSDDAILSKDLNGIIMSWNRGAERIFGYRADEVIGKSVTLLIPQDRQNEEPQILARIRRGERMMHYETVRQRKDGILIDISLTVSPIIDSEGKIVGASKIARDISDRRRAEEQKDLLLREMDHRVKNLFALAGGLVKLSARDADSVQELVSDLGSKFSALARAHALTLETTKTTAQPIATLHALIDDILEPYGRDGLSQARIIVKGPDFAIGNKTLTSLALLLHEFATNSLKYGALSDRAGQIIIDCSEQGEAFHMSWQEPGVKPPEGDIAQEGFGSRLARATISSLSGQFTRTFNSTGLEIEITGSRARMRE